MLFPSIEAFLAEKDTLPYQLISISMLLSEMASIWSFLAVMAILAAPIILYFMNASLWVAGALIKASVRKFMKFPLGYT